MKVKPQIVEDSMHKMYFICPNCNEAITFPLIRNPEHIYDKRPKFCKKCGAEFNWNYKKNSKSPGTLQHTGRLIEVETDV